ncbi:MAG: 4-hydroxybenzoate octaprenyltransferase [Hyphomicrobiaceae bacterium]|nr:4-hydroxybenzoate octaprenyltransferase [Hyphomicrobiaceae bacterium]
MTGNANAAPTVPDALPGNWVNRHAPRRWRPYLRLARFDRPIGAWLLLFPCWWAQTLAGLATDHRMPDPWQLVLFLVGAFVMRGAGCTYNDIVDRDYDAGVARTRGRPIPSGEVGVRQAAVFMVGLCLVGLLVLLQFNAVTVWLGIASLGLVAVYPFMKRFTHWPQLVLGLTFKWGALVGWTAVRGKLEWPAVALYAGSVLWTVAYDTIYAHQDKEDDLALGLKSTAIRFGDTTKAWLAGLYGSAVLLWGLAAVLAGAGIGTAIALTVAAASLAWQVATLDIANPVNCLARFKANRLVGWVFLMGIVADMWLRA